MDHHYLLMQGVYDDYLAGMLDCREQSIKPDDSIEGEEQGLDWRLLFSILASLVLAVVIIGIANTLDWEWYSEHPDFYKLQGAVFAFVFLLSLGFLYPKGRRWAWVGGGIVAAASLIIESLGGKT